MGYHDTSLRHFERKDEGGGDDKALALAVKQIGENTKGAIEKVTRDLETIRTEVKNAAKSSETDEKLAKATTDIATQFEAINKVLEDQKKRADDLETAFERSPSPTGGGDGQDELKEALGFFDTKMSMTGSLKHVSRSTADNSDLDGYKLWAQHYESVLRRDDRYLNSPDEMKALSVGSNPDGGYLVPTARSSRIIGKIYETSPLRQLATVETIGTGELEVPYDRDEAGYGWVGEEEERAETGTPRVGLQKIDVHEMYAKPKVTQTFLEDAAINVENWLESKVADRFARAEAAAFLVGNGIKKPRGLLTYPAGSLGARGTVMQVASGGATTITADALVALPFALKGDYLPNARYLMGRRTVAAIMLLKDLDDQYLWRPGLAEGKPSTLNGYSISMAEDMPNIAAGTLPLAFGDFRRAYTVVDRLGIRFLRDPFSAKPFVEFYYRRRVGGDVVDFEAFLTMVVQS